jgi:hypothetical protein
VRMLDLCCGRLGWAKVFAARGWKVVAIDLVEPPEIPDGVHFVMRDVLGIAKGEIKSSRYDFICASSPCEQFSVHGMKHFHSNPPYPEMGIRLFNHIRTICEASSVPYVMENVRAAQDFVGKAVSHCGPFYLWGNAVPPLLPLGISKGISHRVPGIETMTRAEITAWRRENDPMWSSSKSKKRREATAKAATIPPELANCVADYAQQLIAMEELAK